MELNRSARTILTAQDAKEIYLWKLCIAGQNISERPCDSLQMRKTFEEILHMKSILESYGQRCSSGHIARKYGVKPKTVRDVWNRRTWSHVTSAFWILESPRASLVRCSGISKYVFA